MPLESIQFIGIILLSTWTEELSKEQVWLLQTCRFIPAFTNVRAILRHALNFSVRFDMGKKGNSWIWIVILTHYGSETVSDSGCAPQRKDLDTSGTKENRSLKQDFVVHGCFRRTGAAFLSLQFKPLDLYILILSTGLAGDVSLKWFPCPSVMYAQPVDAQGMIGYSREDEILQLLFEYIRHRENGHGPLIICGKEVHWNKTHFKGRSCYWQLSRGMFRDMLTFLGSGSEPSRLLWSQPWLLGHHRLPKGWWRWDGAREISPGSRSQLHSTDDLLNA